jgi:hypothetical protein
MSDDLTLHPRVRQAINEGNRDKPLTLNWAPVEPDAYDCLGLPALNNRNAMKARTALIAEALAADQWISYSRDNHFYARGQRYYRSIYTYRSILPAIGQLADAGVIEHEKVPPGHRGFQSRFRATPGLLKVTAAMPVEYRPLELVLLRDAAGSLVDYRDNRDTRRMRERLSEINEALLSQRIGFGDQIVREGDSLESGRAQVRLLRIFHRADFRNGGRFYHAFWQNAPKISGFDKTGKYRRGRDQITINGGATAEVDYAGMHIRLLYQEAGRSMPADPYDIGGFPREQAKLALLIAINAPTNIDAVRALADALRLGGGVADPFGTARRLIRAVKALHPDIAEAFGSDAGIRLMRQDSEIAERVMLEMLRATGIVPLCIHDSFVVPTSHEERLKETHGKRVPLSHHGSQNPLSHRLEFGDNLFSCGSRGSSKSV